MDPHSYHRHNYEYQFHKHDQVKPPTSPPRKVQNFVSPRPRQSKCGRCCKEWFQENCNRNIKTRKFPNQIKIFLKIFNLKYFWLWQVCCSNCEFVTAFSLCLIVFSVFLFFYMRCELRKNSLFSTEQDGNSFSQEFYLKQISRRIHFVGFK